jgi:hypothetical protein
VKPSWAEYEALAHEIVTELAPFATVTHDDHVVGRESEARRQIDISARWTDGGDENLLIIQVKDYKRRADVNTVGEFRSVIQDVGAQKGILICSGGFSKQARTYARNLGLLLWSLADARSKKWAMELTVPTLWNRFTPTLHVSGTFRTQSVPLTIQKREDGGIDLWEDDGITLFSLPKTFEASWTARLVSFEPGIKHAFPLDRQLFLRGSRTDGAHEMLPLDIDVTYMVTRESYLAQLPPSDYRGVIDHLDEGQFVPSHLDMRIPSLDTDVWTRVSDPSRLAVNVRGSFITLEDSRIGNPMWTPWTLKRIGDNDQR